MICKKEKRKKSSKAKKIDYLFSVELKNVRIYLFYWKYAAYCFLFRKVCKNDLKLLNNSKKSVNHAFFLKKESVKHALMQENL